MFDYIIIGAGMAGCVMAERIANVLDKKVLIIEKRNHIGGNCYDYYDKNGLLVHKYGPHIFHTNIKNVWGYLSQFTDWINYQHYVLGFIDGKNVPIPFNLNTLHELLPKNLSEKLEKKLIEKYGYNTKIPIIELKESEDENLKYLADFIYEKVFLNYTKKQWEMKPKELDPSVTERIPVYISKDNRYFQDQYQGIPKEGYTKMFEKMLNNKHIKIMLNTDFKEVIHLNNNKLYLLGNKVNVKLIFTGKIDEFFCYKMGELPYRSLKFNFETISKDFYQVVGTVNYPNNYDFTRITEFKHLTGQKSFKTSIVKEYPQEYHKDIKGKDVPCYPVPKKENEDLYKKYKEEAKKLDNLIFVGRLAEYRYYNMDIVIYNALKLFKELLNE